MSKTMKLDPRFEKEFDRLRDTYGKQLAALNGFADEQLNYTDFIDQFVDKQTVADATIDGNANVGHKDIVSLENEMSKPHSKLLAFSKIYYELCKKYGEGVAKDWLENEWDGHFYLHDAYNTSFKSYCFAYDLEQIVNRGLFFVENFNSQPPKHLTTFTDFVGEFVSFACNRSSGAVGLPSFLIYSFYFWHKDCKENYVLKDPAYYRDQSFQEIIYKLNQPYLRSGIQSAFTNFSIFDRPYLEALFGGKTYPDGSFVVDYIDEILEYEKAFMQVVSEVRAQNMMTFPVLTFALLRQDGKFVDEEFAKWCCAHNMRWGDSNFFISDDVTSLSNCCLDGDEPVVVRDETGVYYKPIREVANSRPWKPLSVLHNGSWVSAKPIKAAYRGDMYKIVTANNKSVRVTGNHFIPTLRGDIRADEVNTEDYVLFNTRALQAYKERDRHLTYAQGVLVGCYAGDGSSNSSTVTLSLNNTKVLKLGKLIEQGAYEIDPNCMISIKQYDDSKLVSMYIKSLPVKAFIKQFLIGGRSFNKQFDASILYESYAFRKGILDGWYGTDGGNSNRIYSVSPALIATGEMLCTSLGINTITDCDASRVGEVAFVDGGKTYTHNYPIWCLRFYADTNRRQTNNIYMVRNNSVYFKVKAISTYQPTDEYAYCFEMKNVDEPYFTLPNGMITHNCRLKSNIKDLGYFNSIGGTALEVGSVKVNTINLARIAYESATTEEYLNTLSAKTVLCLKVLDRVRHIIARNVEKGLLPNYSLGLMHMDKQYNTIGIIGIYEALEKFGMTYKDEMGNTYYSDEGIEFAKQILRTITENKNEFARSCDYMINIEQIPGERAASVLMQKDKFFFPHEAYDLPLYGNQWIPLGVQTTMHEKIRLSAIMDEACSGGSIMHVNLDAPIEDFDTAWNLLNYIADAGVQYFAFNLRISACKHNHGFYGKTCPICGEPVETTYQRIVGFLVPTKTYSKERKAEFSVRTWFDVLGDDLA